MIAVSLRVVSAAPTKTNAVALVSYSIRHELGRYAFSEVESGFDSSQIESASGYRLMTDNPLNALRVRAVLYNLVRRSGLHDG